MNAIELRALVLSSLGEIAPEVDLAAVDPAASLQEKLDIDSMDFLDFVVSLSERTGIEVPESDYSDLATVDACVSYLGARVDGGEAAG